MFLRRKPLARFTIALLLAIGVAFAWAFLLSTVTQVLLRANQNRVSAHDQLVVRQDGTPLVATCDARSARTEFRYLDGSTPEDGPAQKQIAGASLSPVRDRAKRWSERVLSFTSMLDSTWWYFLHTGDAEGLGYFVGFDPNTKRQIGFIGRHGFRTDEPRDDEKIPFHGNRWPGSQIVYPNGYLAQGSPPGAYAAPYADPTTSQLILISSGNLLRLNLMRRSLETTYDGGDIDSIATRNIAHYATMDFASTTQMPPRREILDADDTNKLALRTDDAILFANAQGQVTDRFPLPEELRQSTFTAYLLPDQQCLLDEWGVGPRELIWLSKDGSIARRQELLLHDRVTMSLMNHPFFQVASFPVPIAYAMQLAHTHFVTDNWRFIAPSAPRVAWLAMGLLTAVSIGLAYVCFRRQRAYHFANAWGWALLVLLLGIPGYLGYRYHRTWPTVDRCPHCDTQTTIRGGQCARCHEPFPLPEPTGVEILA